jgi:hypothetical protein
MPKKKATSAILEAINIISDSTEGDISFECNSRIEPTTWWFQEPKTKITTITVTIKEQI